MTKANTKIAADNAAVDTVIANAEQIDRDIASMLSRYGYQKTVAGIREKYLREQKLNLGRYMMLMASARRLYDQMKYGNPPPIQ